MDRSRSPKHVKKSKNPISTFLVILVIFCLVIILGIYISASLAPVDGESGPSTNSVISPIPSLKSKIQELIPKDIRMSDPSFSSGDLPETELPDYSQTFWTPIDYDGGRDPMITLCKLNFKEYAESPHLYAMFRDLQANSNCGGKNKRREKLSILLKDIQNKQGTPEGRVIPPTGFVFHESRVGSTLVANSLASDPWSMVFSESTPTANALLYCNSCSRQEQIDNFRGIVTLMGRSPIHKRMFFKFQSITTTVMDIALEAFPDTPWAFVYRQPVQTMMSHLDPRKGSSGAPCLRSMSRPPNEVKETISWAVGTAYPPKEAWCAAHLHMLCTHALQAYEKYGKFAELSSINSQLPADERKQRGLLINYDSLPGIIPQVMLPMFGVQPSSRWLNKMSEESQTYSKGKGQTRSFSGDSQDKDTHATEEIKTFADKILMRSYESLSRLSEQALSVGAPEVFSGLAKHGSGTGGSLSLSLSLVSGLSPEESREGWSGLRDIPSQLSESSLQVYQHSAVLSRKKYSSPSKNNNNELQLSTPILQQQSTQISPSQSDLGSETAVFESLTGGQRVLNPHSHFDPMKYAPWAPFSNTHNSRPYEVLDCPLVPQPGYPKTYQMLKILDNWGADNTEIPPFHYDSLCHFDYQNKSHLDAAFLYQKLELPFVMYNIPELDQVAKKWSDLDYLQNKLGKRKYRTETSKDNHFMYWRGGGFRQISNRDGSKWTPPTSVIQESFEDWVQLAVKGQNTSLENREHQYFRVSSDMGNEWLFNELPFFQPKKSIFLVEPRFQQGIHCRFGMRNVIAEAHFDGGRNAVVMIGGLRRWILTHPDQCKNMHMYMNDHPSSRHSEVDWSKPDIQSFPNFPKVQGNEVILQPGDFLWVPTYWIHYIVSLNLNYQCNTRSGVTDLYKPQLRDCGF